MSDVIEEVLRKAREKKPQDQQSISRFGTFGKMASALEQARQDAVKSGALQNKLDSAPRMMSRLTEVKKLEDLESFPPDAKKYNPFPEVNGSRRKQ